MIYLKIDGETVSKWMKVGEIAYQFAGNVCQTSACYNAFGC